MEQTKDKLLEVYNKILSLDPGNEEANAGVANLLLDEGELHKAMPYIEAAVSKGSKDRRLRNFAAYYYSKAGSLQKTRAMLQDGPLPQKKDELAAIFESLSILAIDAFNRRDAFEAFTMAKKACMASGQGANNLGPVIAESAVKLAEECLKRKELKQAYEYVSDAGDFVAGNKVLIEKTKQFEELLKQAKRKKLFISLGIGAALFAAITAVAAVLVVMPKGNKEKEGSAGKMEGAGPGSVTPSATSGSASVATGPKLAPEDFILNKWAKPQQVGDSAEYQAILSDDFLGISIRLDKKTEYNKSEWLKRRENALSTGIQFSLNNIVVTKDPSGGVDARFDYQWNSNDYCDKGQKNLMLRPDGDSWLVIREETLTSGECAFASFSTFRTFVGAFARAILKKQWDYVDEHSQYPIRINDSFSTFLVKDVKGVKDLAWLSEFRWARVEKKGFKKTVDSTTYNYVSYYDGSTRGSVVVQVYDVLAGTQYSTKYIFDFDQDRWFWRERYYLGN